MAHTLYDTTPLRPLVAQGFVLLTPNLRLARRIKSDWDAQRATDGEQGWESLPVAPLESWLLQRWHDAVTAGLLPARLQLTPAQGLHLWQQLIAEDERRGEQYHLLRPAAAAEIASQARDTLLRWQLDTSQPAVRQQFQLDNDCETFLRWLDLFQQRLQEAGLVTAADCMAQLHQCAPQLAPARAVLLEFEDIPPLLRATVTALCDEVREFHPERDQATRLLHACENKRAELQAVASWAVATSRAQPGARTGIVLSDMAADRTALEYLLRREFDCLGERYDSLPVNFSTGITLDRAPVIRDALAALAMALPVTTVPAVVKLLHSRFLDLPDAATPLANLLLTRLFDAGRKEIPVAELRYSASEITLQQNKGLALGRHLISLAKLRTLRERALPSQWVERFCEILSIWGWPGSDSLDSLEYQQVELWYRTLDEFCKYDVVSGPLAFAEVLPLLRSSCAKQTFQPQTADSDIQVLGPLEAAGLVFDHLWLVGMQAGSWPAAPRPNPFIPVALQRAGQMPHATPEREWSFAAGLLAQYAGAATELRASYCRELEGVSELPSALLQDFVPTEPGVAAPGPGAWRAPQQGAHMEYLDDSAGPAADSAELAAMAGGSGLLEDQSQCPFRAFARRRLQVEALGAFGIGLSPADRGSLLHDALYALWGSLGDHRGLLALDNDARAAEVAAAVSAAMAGLPVRLRRAHSNKYWELEGQRLQSLLHEWLDVEQARGEFAVSQREEEVSLQLGQLSIRLRVDRIDELPDGSRLIIDYKSGSSKVQDWLGERPASPQLLLYGIAAPGAAAALAFAQVRPRDSRFVGLGSVAAAPGIQTDIGKAVRGRMDADSWEALNARWRENLERLAQAFVAGEAAVDPLGPTSCTWCGLQPLCRIGSELAQEGAP